MQLICGLFGHQPAPLGTRKREGRLHNHCVLCRQPVERVCAGGAWTLAEPAAEERATG